MGEINLSLRGLLGKRKALDFVSRVVYPELENLVKSGQIETHELRKIRDLVRTRGVEILEPQVRCIDEVTLNTVEQDGYIVEVSLPITDKTAIRTVIKKSSERENFKQAVKNQKRANEVLVGTEFEGQVPFPQFVNKRQRIMVTPFVEGVTLKEALDYIPQLQKSAIDKGLDISSLFFSAGFTKEDKLIKVIDRYAELFAYLNNPEVSRRLKFPQSMINFNLFFKENYIDLKPGSHLFDIFREEIGDELNERQSYNIHGDFHPKNILVNGKLVLLDWANAASNGFPEFDIGKLLTKANISKDLEEKLAQYAAERLNDNKEEQHTSVNVYNKNQIAQELLSAKRYLDRAKHAKTEDIAGKLHGMANVWFNSALRRIRKNVDRGTLSRQLLEAVVAEKPEGVKEVSDNDFENLKKVYNPHTLMSQEAMQPTTPLIELVKDDPQDNLKEIRKAISRRRFFGMAKDYGLPVVAAVAAVGAGKIMNDFYMERSELIKVQRDNLEQYRDHLKQVYNNVVLLAAEGIKLHTINAFGDEVKETASRNSIDFSILGNILILNKAYVRLYMSLFDERVAGINILDPLSISKSDKIMDLKYNLFKGAERLGNLVKSSEGDIKKALVEFYKPNENTNWAISNNFYPEEIFDLAKKEARMLAYNAFRGIKFQDGIRWAVIEEQVPEVFPRILHVREPPKEPIKKYIPTGAIMAN